MDLNQLINEYGLTLALAVWIIIGLARLVKTEIPGTIDFFKKTAEDTQEHRQKLERDRDRVRNLEYLSAMGSKTFTEEQLTLMTSEAQTQLAEANEFIRKDVSSRLDILTANLAALDNKLDAIPDELREEFRQDLRQIATNWQQALLEYRHVQTKLVLITSLMEQVVESRGDEE